MLSVSDLVGIAIPDLKIFLGCFFTWVLTMMEGRSEGEGEVQCEGGRTF